MKEKLIHITDFAPLAAVAPANVPQVVQSVELPRNYLYAELILLSLVSITDNGVGGLVPIYTQDFQHRTAARLTVRDESDDPINVAGRLLGMAFSEPLQGVVNDFQFTAPAVGGVHNVENTYRIPFYDPRAGDQVTRVSTMIRSWARKKFSFEVLTPLVADIMGPGVGSAVALTAVWNRLYARVYEVTADERAIFDAALVHKLRLRDTFEEYPGAVAYRAFLNTDLNRGNKTLRLHTMFTDGLVRAVLPVEMGVRVADQPIFGPNIPEDVVTAENVKDYAFAVPNGVYIIDMDRERAHVGCPETTGLENFRFDFSSIAPPLGLGRLDVLQVEKALAGYAPVSK